MINSEYLDLSFNDQAATLYDNEYKSNLSKPKADKIIIDFE